MFEEQTKAWCVSGSGRAVGRAEGAVREDSGLIRSSFVSYGMEFGFYVTGTLNCVQKKIWKDNCHALNSGHPEERGLRYKRGKDGLTETAKLMSSYKVGGKPRATHRLGGTQPQGGRRFRQEVWGGDGGTCYPDTSGRAQGKGKCEVAQGTLPG